MKRVLRGIGVIIITITMLFAVSSCMLFQSPITGFDDPVEMVESYENDLLKAVRESEDSSLKLTDKLADIIKNYYYLDDSINDYEGGKDRAVNTIAAQLAVALQLVEAFAGDNLEKIFEVNNPHYTKVSTPDLPDKVKAHVEEVGKVTYTNGLSENEKSMVIRVNGKWFIGLLYYDGSNIQNYPSEE